MFFVYDSYLTNRNEWRQILARNEPASIRNTQYDADMIALALTLNGIKKCF